MDSFTIPPAILRMMIRAYSIPLIGWFALIAVFSLANPYSVRGLEGPVGNHVVWGMLFLIVTLWLSHGMADGKLGLFFGYGLLASVALMGMATVASLFAGDVVVAAWWLLWGWNNSLVLLAWHFAQPARHLILYDQVTWLRQQPLRVLARVRRGRSKRKGGVP
jgi:hypothetical protein